MLTRPPRPPASPPSSTSTGQRPLPRRACTWPSRCFKPASARGGRARRARRRRRSGRPRRPLPQGVARCSPPSMPPPPTYSPLLSPSPGFSQVLSAIRPGSLRHPSRPLSSLPYTAPLLSLLFPGARRHPSRRAHEAEDERARLPGALRAVDAPAQLGGNGAASVRAKEDRSAQARRSRRRGRGGRRAARAGRAR